MRQLWERSVAAAVDGAMCAAMNFLQRRQNRHAPTWEEFTGYLAEHAQVTREDFYHAPPLAGLKEEGGWLEWDSPRPSGVAANDRARVRLYLCQGGITAPTVLILHSLMSANDSGYVKLARWFNTRGWNAAFPHLPFHYSRVPSGAMNGELAVTANLVRNAQNIQQCVVELRQFMALLRSRGCEEFAVVATSWGGWNGSLLSFVEPDLRFLALIQPIVDLEHATWGNPISVSMRRYLLSQGYVPGRFLEHSHLSSPLHGVPLCSGERCLITGGLYDAISPIGQLRELQKRWPGSRLIEVAQGHFGYRAMRATLPEIERFL